jgi:hypothetical protein
VTATEIETEQHKWIAFAHLIAKGSIPISEPTLERIARMQHFEGNDRLYWAEKHIRNTVRVLLAARDSSARTSIIKFFGQLYKHEKGEAVEL